VSTNGHLTPERIRARLSHPIVDADGHWVEYGLVVSEHIRKIGGDRAAGGFLSIGRQTREALSLGVAERKRRRISQESFWSSPSRNTRDRATGMLPRLLYERLGELGIDFAILYPTTELRVSRIDDDGTRRAAWAGASCSSPISSATGTSATARRWSTQIPVR